MAEMKDTFAIPPTADKLLAAPISVWEKIDAAIKFYASVETYLPPRTGGVAQGCPRSGPTPISQDRGRAASDVLTELVKLYPLASAATALSSSAESKDVLDACEKKVQAKSNDALFRSAYMIGATDALELASKFNAAPQEATAEASSEVDREAGQVMQSGGSHSHPVPRQESQNGPAGAAPLTVSATHDKQMERDAARYEEIVQILLEGGAISHHPNRLEWVVLDGKGNSSIVKGSLSTALDERMSAIDDRAVKP